MLLAVLALSFEVEAAEPKQKLLREGQMAPDFTLRTLDQRPVRLKKLRGKPLLVDFFRRDCAPCLKTFPELVELQKTYAPQGLQILLVALVEHGDDDLRLLKQFLAKEKPPFTIVVDPGDAVAAKYLGTAPQQLPGTFLIDAKGAIVKLKYGGAGGVRAELEPSIQTILAPKP
jgi:peroxiredoxin